MIEESFQFKRSQMHENEGFWVKFIQYFTIVEQKFQIQEI